MVKNPFLKKARKYEEDAFRMEQLEYKGVSKSKRLSDAYKKAAEEYEGKGFLERAFSNYKDAFKFAPKQDEDEIGKKLNELERRKKETVKFPKRTSGGLETYFSFAILAVGSFVIALFFVSFSLTGYAVGGLTQENSRWISTSLFILGLVFAFFYFKNKK